MVLIRPSLPFNNCSVNSRRLTLIGWLSQMLIVQACSKVTKRFLSSWVKNILWWLHLVGCWYIVWMGTVPPVKSPPVGDVLGLIGSDLHYEGYLSGEGKEWTKIKQVTCIYLVGPLFWKSLFLERYSKNVLHEQKKKKRRYCGRIEGVNRLSTHPNTCLYGYRYVRICFCVVHA